ncbi:hypothetical protein OAO87_02470 [bacterium]|nr:hypothetical protein [bacterium]
MTRAYKEDASVAYNTNSRSRAAHGDIIDAVSACVVSFAAEARRAPWDA